MRACAISVQVPTKTLLNGRPLETTVPYSYQEKNMENKVLRPDFYQIPTVILDDPECTFLDGIVYAVVYWYAKLRLEKCTASNETIAKQAKSTKSSVANSLSRLNKKKFIKVILDKQNHRLEIIPLITFTPSHVNEAPSLTGEPPFIDRLTPPSFTGEHNKNNNNKNIKEETNITSVILEAKPTKVDKRDPDIQLCMDELIRLTGIKPRRESLNRFALKRLIRAYGCERIVQAINFAFKIRDEDRYSPRVYNYIDLEEKWQNLLDYGKKKGVRAAPNSVNLSDLARQRKEATVHVLENT